MPIQSVSPLTNKVIATHEVHSPEHLSAMVKYAVEYEKEFASISLEERGKLLLIFQKVLDQHKAELAAIIHQSVGKPLTDAEVEIADIMAGIEVYVKRIPELKKYLEPLPEKNIVPESAFKFYYQPIGTVGAIMPWNFPFWMPMSFIVPALLAGNPVILKPSQQAIPVGKYIKKLISEAGFTDAALQVVIGGPTIGSALVQHPEIKKIAFVGSTEVGQRLAQQRVMHDHNHFTMEMGGNSAAIIDTTDHLENAIKAVFWNGTYYAGQVCTGVKRVLIHTSIFDQVAEKMFNLAQKYNKPEALVENIGALINKETIKQVEYRIEQAVQKGNTLLCGGKHISSTELPTQYQNGNFFPITILKITNRKVDLVMKETFAPVLPLIPFSSKEEAVLIANETPFELSANVFADNPETIECYTKNLEAGMLFINDSEVSYPGGNYWHGHGQSYISTSGEDRLMSMYTKKTVWSKNPDVRREYWFS